MDPQSFDAKLQITKEHLLEYILDHAHFIARWLTAIKEKAAPNLDEESLAKIIVNLFGFWMLFSNHAEFFTNLILVGVPLLLFFVYPDEKPSDEDLLIYWPCFALVTLFDFLLKIVPGYYTLKLILFASFFLRPWCAVQKIRQYLLLLQLYRAAVDISQRVQEVQQIPPDMLSRILTAQDNGPSESRAQMPPLSLLAPQLASATSTTTAAEMPHAGTSTARSNASLERKYTVGSKQSHYVSLKPKSETKLVNPAPSIYANTQEQTKKPDGKM